MARCRYILDDLSNNINKLQLKIKKFGKTTGTTNHEMDMLTMQSPNNTKILVSPRRSLRGPNVPMIVHTEKTTVASSGKGSNLKSKKKKD